MGSAPLKPTISSAATNTATPLTESTTTVEPSPELQAREIVPEFIDLPEGKELSETAAMSLANARPVQWIVLAGPIDSGKTTLLTSLYELFQWRLVEDFAFAGSNTLPGFEERCYLSRRASGNTVPQTQRTLYKGPDPAYLHLRVRHTKGLRPFRDFVFTDVSGEMFEHARDSTTECKDMTFIKRANHLLYFLDSAKAVRTDTRWAILEDAKALLRSFVDCEMISPYCTVNVIWSRFDYFASHQADGRHEAYRADAEKELLDTLGGKLPKLIFGRIAARPLEAPALGLAYGVPALMKQWATAPLEQTASGLFPASYSGTRESELFAIRHFSGENAHE
jgi:hypothetical protein